MKKTKVYCKNCKYYEIVCTDMGDSDDCNHKNNIKTLKADYSGYVHSYNIKKPSEINAKCNCIWYKKVFGKFWVK